MANEEQYYNPIIGAYLKAKGMQQETQQNAARLKLEQQKQDAEEQARTESLKQAKERIDNEHALQLSQAEQIKSAMAHSALQSKQQLANAMQSLLQHGAHPTVAARLLGGSAQQGTQELGVPQLPPTQDPNTGTMIPQGGTPTTVTLPGIDQPIDVSGLGNSPEFQVDQLRKQAQAQAEGTGAGTLPTKLAEIGATAAAQKSLKEMEQTFTAGQESKKIISQEKIAKMGRDTQLLVGQANNATQLGVAHISHDISDDDLKSGVIAALTGQRRFNSDNKFDLAVMSGVQQAGGRPIDPKDIDALKQEQMIVPLFDKLEKYAKDNLPSERTNGSVGAKAKAYLLGKTLETSVPTDAKNDLAQIKMQAINAGKTLEGLTGGRVTQLQMQTAMDGVAGATTYEQAQERIQNLRDMIINKEQNVILGGVPEAQKKLIYHSLGVKPVSESTAKGAQSGAGTHIHFDAQGNMVQ